MAFTDDSTWPHCYVDPREGTALFDGLLIKTDSIYKSTTDRVMPVFEEEQVFMSRMMRPWLQAKKAEGRSLRVLDVGTGCGVFAIVAAQEGCCVVAIDSDPRACMFARYNAHTVNGIKRADRADSVEPYQICVLNEGFPGIDLGEFDVVILSPPYNPTQPALARKIAGHAADAGENGQKVFERQIKAVPRVLKRGGICFGNQMSIVMGSEELPPDLHTCADLIRSSARERLHLIHWVRQAFAEAFTLRCAPILRELEDSESFLQKQYEGLAEQLDAQPKQLDAQSSTQGTVRQWCHDKSQEFRYLAFLYYEVEMTGSGRVTVTDDPPWRKGFDERPHSWDDRIYLHRTVVEHTLPNDGSDPLPSFVTDGTTDTILSHLSTPEPENTKLIKDDYFEMNLLSLIDRVIRSQRFGSLFDVIYLDTAPIYPGEEGHYNLNLERRCWVNGKVDKLALAVRDRWLPVTKALQTSNCAIGMHPAFVGMADRKLPWEWPHIISTHIPPSRDDPMVEYALKLMKPEFDAALRNASDDITRVNDVDELAYSFSSLRNLHVQVYHDNERRVDDRVKELRERLKETFRRDISEEDGRRIDLKACHWLMHKAVHSHFFEKLVKVSPPEAESMCFSIPLGLLYLPKRRAEAAVNSPGFPSFFKGGLWAWLVPNKNKERPNLDLQHESAAYHLLRVMWLLLNSSYVSRSEEAHSTQAINEVIDVFAHDVKKLSNALTEKMIHSAKDFFEVVRLPQTSASMRGKLGQIELAADAADQLAADAADLDLPDFGVTFFRKSVTSAGKMINLWCQAANPADAHKMVDMVDRSVDDLPKLARACWRIAVEAIPVFALAKQFYVPPVNAMEALTLQKRREQSILSLFRHGLDGPDSFRLQVTQKGGDFPSLDWNDTGGYTVGLARLLLALLGNAAAHGDPVQVPEVNCQWLGNDGFQITVINHVRREDERAIVDDLLNRYRGVDLKFNSEDAEEGLQRMASARMIMEHAQQGKFGTKEVVESLLKKLDGEIIRWPDKGRRGFDLRLMSSLNDASGIPTEGKNLIIVAAVNHVLHFRIFDGDGQVDVDTDEKRLTGQARQIEDLREQLERLWPPHKLTTGDKGPVITAVTAIVGLTRWSVSVKFNYRPEGGGVS